MANGLADREMSTMGISYGSPYDQRDLLKVRQGLEDAYFNAIQAAPEWLMEHMAPEDPYTPGVLQSGPRDRIRALGLHREQDIAQRRQELGRDYEQGMDFGTALSLVADPYVDLPLAGIPAIGKALKLSAPARSTRPFNALGDLGGDEAGVIRAYHGTPHEVDKFRMANIGTGEGAQAYGHGLYFAESPDVAKSYAPRDYDFEDKLLAKYQKASDSGDYASAEVYEAAMLHETPKEIRKTYTVENGYDEDFVENANRIADELTSDTKKQSLYEVDLDINVEDLLDWDLPLSKQPEKTKKALQNYGELYPDSNINKLTEGGDVTGEALYSAIVRDVRESKGTIGKGILNDQAEKLASERIRFSGIPGIRYLDAGSRSAGEGSRNVVMLNEDLINIIGKE